MNAIYLSAIFVLTLLPSSIAQAQGPDTVAAPSESLVATVHAEGAQVYECKAMRPAILFGYSANPSRR